MVRREAIGGCDTRATSEAVLSGSPLTLGSWDATAAVCGGVGLVGSGRKPRGIAGEIRWDRGN